MYACRWRTDPQIYPQILGEVVATRGSPDITPSLGLCCPQHSEYISPAPSQRVSEEG
jgi:hypothetical protein